MLRFRTKLLGGIFTLDAILLFHGKIFYKMFVLYGYEDTCFSKMIRLFSENFTPADSRYVAKPR